MSEPCKQSWGGGNTEGGKLFIPRRKTGSSNLGNSGASGTDDSVHPILVGESSVLVRFALFDSQSSMSGGSLVRFWDPFLAEVWANSTVKKITYLLPQFMKDFLPILISMAKANEVEELTNDSRLFIIHVIPIQRDFDAVFLIKW